MEFSVLKIELLFTLIQQFNLSLHIEQRKFQISPPPDVKNEVEMLLVVEQQNIEKCLK